MNDRSFLTGDQELVSTAQKADGVDGIVNDPSNLSYWGIALWNWVESDTPIRMAWVDDGLDCITVNKFDRLSASNGQQVSCFFYFPNLYLLVLGATHTFLFRTRPGYTVYFVAMAHKRV